MSKRTSMLIDRKKWIKRVRHVYDANISRLKYRRYTLLYYLRYGLIDELVEIFEQGVRGAQHSTAGELSTVLSVNSTKKQPNLTTEKNLSSFGVWNSWEYAILTELVQEYKKRRERSKT